MNKSAKYKVINSLWIKENAAGIQTDATGMGLCQWGPQLSDFMLIGGDNKYVFSALMDVEQWARL